MSSNVRDTVTKARLGGESIKYLAVYILENSVAVCACEKLWITICARPDILIELDSTLGARLLMTFTVVPVRLKRYLLLIPSKSGASVQELHSVGTN